MVLELEHASESTEGLVKTQNAGPSFRFPDSAPLEWSPMICISNKFPGGTAAAARAGTTLWESLPCLSLPIPYYPRETKAQGKLIHSFMDSGNIY